MRRVDERPAEPRGERGAFALAPSRNGCAAGRAWRRMQRSAILIGRVGCCIVALEMTIQFLGQIGERRAPRRIVAGLQRTGRQRQAARRLPMPRSTRPGASDASRLKFSAILYGL